MLAKHSWRCCSEKASSVKASSVTQHHSCTSSVLQESHKAAVAIPIDIEAQLHTQTRKWQKDAVNVLNTRHTSPSHQQDGRQIVSSVGEGGEGLAGKAVVWSLVHLTQHACAI